MIIKPGQNTVKFIERRGLKFFSPFWAVDKGREAIKIHYDGTPGVSSRILASNEYGRVLGQYNIKFLKDERAIKASTLVVDDNDHGRGIGQMLTLSGLIELFANKLNTFKLFSLKDTMGFHAKMGFKLDTDDVDYIKYGLKFIKKKDKIDHYAARDADFFLSRITNPEKLKEDPSLLEHAAYVISKYMTDIMRRGQEWHMPLYMQGSNFKFTDWEILVEKNYLNELLKKYKIDFHF